MPLIFHSEETSFSIPQNNIAEKWVDLVLSKANCSLGDINVIFSSNDYLLKINKEYLNHHYFTDVITFNYNDGSKISGDIFVSVDQVEINAVEFGVDFLDELNRVMIHGVLHLIGYDDKDDESQTEMTKMENDSLSLLEEIKHE